MKSILILIAFIGFSFLSSGYANAAENPVKKVVYLSGTDNENTVSWDFFCTGGRKSGEWTTIEVPSCWEQQGFGTYNYGRDYVTYGKTYPFADEKGMYRHKFSLPANMKGKNVFIVFEGSMTDTEVKINGTSAGNIHQGSFYRFKYDISDKLFFDGENLLEVTVSKMSSDNSVNRAERYADYWIFGGIFRPVYLEVYPEEFIDHSGITAKADGTFKAEVFLRNIKGKREVRAEVIDASGKIVATANTTANTNDSLVILECRLQEPVLWTSETPYLYKVKFSLTDKNKTIFQAVEKTGFRTVEVRHGDGIYLNGIKIKMKGINRHSFWPESGRTLNPSIDLLDVKLIKEMNMNAVRTSHYPPDKSFLELCDSLGLYVLDELAGWQNAYNTKVGENLVREMVLRDLNHPSIIFWSNGNEGGTNKELDDDFLIYDHSGREVIHAHHRPGNSFNGIETNHYENYKSFESILQDTLIYMTTEFLHCQNDGGGGAALEDYWELMYHSEMSGGGFLWVFADEGVVRTDLDGAVDANLVNAPDGVVGPHREKEGSFYAIREIFCPVKISMKELPADFNGSINVENRYFFTNLDKTRYKFQVVRFRDAFDTQSGHTILFEGKVSGPRVAPGKSGDLRLELPVSWIEGDALYLTGIDSHGNEIMTWSWMMNPQLESIKNRLAGKGAKEVEMTETDSTVTMSAAGISLRISKVSGNLEKVINNTNRETSFKNGPLLVAGTATPLKTEIFKEDEAYTVKVNYSGNLNYVRWKMYPTGWVEMNYSFELEGFYDFAGISFDLEEGNVMSAKWLGNGPYRVWKNRLQGGRLDVWEKAYNNTITGTFPWNYPEFKGYYSNVSWMELNTVEGKILVASPDPGLFVRLFEFYGFPEPTPYPELPVGDISFLERIPPIGTKMSTGINARPSVLGPNSSKNDVNQAFERTLYFSFGILPN